MPPQIVFYIVSYFDILFNKNIAEIYDFSVIWIRINKKSPETPHNVLRDFLL